MLSDISAASENQRPHVLVRGGLAAIARQDVAAIFDARSLSIRAVQLTQPVESISELNHLLAQIDAPQVPAGEIQSALPMITPAFLPLIKEGVRARLSRLTLNIANACNLWCSYCYADHGMYHSPSSLLKPEQAVEMVRRALKFYSGFKAIQFFGGEPLLNPRAMDLVCEYLTEELGGGCPEFVATTNGTILGDDVEDVLLRHRIKLTISLDGPMNIHDRLRPSREKEKSHARILRNIDRLRSLDVPIDFECTFTTAHLELGISVCDLLDYFWKALGENRPHISWAYLPKPSLSTDTAQNSLGIFRGSVPSQTRSHLGPAVAAPLFRAAARKSIENIILNSGAALTFIIGILQNLGARTPARGYCPAFTSQLSVAADGSVFPCFMFIGDRRMKMGNILDPSFSVQRVNEIWNMYRSGFKGLATGSDAWYAGLISGCVAGDFIATGEFGHRLYEPVQEAMIEEVVLGLAAHTLKSNKEGDKHVC